jgi:hypothetical protein
MRRPPSHSDSFLYGPNTDTLEPLVLPTRAVVVVVPPAPVIICTWFDSVPEYTLRFLLHITLISVFETVFFFLFVSKDEDAGILAATDYYTTAVVQSCSTLTYNESALINSILERYINGSTIIAAGVAAARQRQLVNTGLMKQSYLYIAGLGSIMGVIGLAAIWRRYKVAWLHVLGENLMFVTLLGLYEYMFFKTIIKNYDVETTDEVSSGFVQGLQQHCGLLTG